MTVFLPISGNKLYRRYCLQYPERCGYIIGPSYYQKPPSSTTFVLDNDAFGCWKRNIPFDANAWLKMMNSVASAGLVPEWCVVPDVVADRDGTLRNWEIHAKTVDSFGWPKAFVIQDGMTIQDLPDSDIYFLGGSTDFKWNTAHHWASVVSRLHIGRVRSKRIHYCEEIGAESCDGSGWLRETVLGRPFRQFESWLFKMNIQHKLTFSEPAP